MTVWSELRIILSNKISQDERQMVSHVVSCLMNVLKNNNSLIIVGVKMNTGAAEGCRKIRGERAGKSLVRRPWEALDWNKCCHAFTDQNG